MKKTLSLLLGLCLLLSLFGCGGDKAGSASSVVSAVPTLAPTAAPTPKMSKAVKIEADGGLNVRANASSEGEILGLADNGEILPLMVEDQKDGWYQVFYQGEKGYVFAEYVKPVDISPEEYNQLKNGESSSLPSKAESSASSEPTSEGGSESSAAPSSRNMEDGE